MPERDGYIPGVPCWVDTIQPDVEAGLAFYSGLFGWEFENVPAGVSAPPYFVARLRGLDVAGVGAPAEGAAARATWNTYVWVASADEAAGQARRAGGSATVEPVPVMDAGRVAVLTDPEGAELYAWEAKDHKGARIVNEHGTLNFNRLATRDRKGAEAFYGAVLGWRTLELAAGVMWTLPGYGDHLEENSPGLREQMAKMDAPDGFIDVVAALEPIADDDTPAHWSVVFAVDDVRAIAENARRLGGEIVAGPSDAPWTRVALIRDPQGATFVASQFVPENQAIEA